MRKRMLVLLGILLCCASVALAAVTITEQPETQTVEAGGKVSFSLKATGAGNSGITWHFVSPDGTEDVTGRKLEARFRGLKVSSPNTQKITLNKVPEAYVNKPLSELGIKKEHNILVMLVDRGKAEPATADTVFHTGDKLTVFGDYRTICEVFDAQERFDAE